MKDLSKVTPEMLLASSEAYDGSQQNFIDAFQAAINAAPELKIYELVDASSDEMYFPIGLFTSLEDAVAAVDKMTDPESYISEYADCGGYESIEIRERPLGLGDNWEMVFSQSRSQVYCEDRDQYIWEIVE